jgi:hypothetical protein
MVAGSCSGLRVVSLLPVVRELGAGLGVNRNFLSESRTVSRAAGTLVGVLFFLTVLTVTSESDRIPTTQ